MLLLFHATKDNVSNTEQIKVFVPLLLSMMSKKFRDKEYNDNTLKILLNTCTSIHVFCLSLSVDLSSWEIQWGKKQKPKAQKKKNSHYPLSV